MDPTCSAEGEVHIADRCFVVARTEPGPRRHAGPSYLRVPISERLLGLPQEPRS